jgi:DNA-binding NarL/FixJ family response regulator
VNPSSGAARAGPTPADGTAWPPHDGPSADARVLIVDDHELLAESLAFSLRRAGVEARLAPTGSARAIVAMAHLYQPDAVLLDLALGELSGTSLIGPLREATGAPVLVLTGATDRIRLAECLEAGAIGVASKSWRFQVLLEQVLDVLAGASPLPEGERVALLDELRGRRAEEERRLAPFRTLTPKERCVLAALMEGRSPKEIAVASYVGVGTVRSQIKAIHQKLGVSSQLAAVALARQAGWSISPL